MTALNESPTIAHSATGHRHAVLPTRCRSLRRRDCLALALFALTPLAEAASEARIVEIWKSPSCGCCREWMGAMRASGFEPRAVDIGNVAVRKGLGMPEKYGSCHTARVGGYVIEGHVPPREIQRLLRERPNALGVAVPGMPIGSAGMDGPAYKDRRDPYDVLLVLRDGSSTVYQSYR